MMRFKIAFERQMVHERLALHCFGVCGLWDLEER
jgi:hypothetical protein